MDILTKKFGRPELFAYLWPRFFRIAKIRQYKPILVIMKKFFLLLAAAASATATFAEGYQVNNLSSRQNGMAHVGTAMKLGSESLWFNPAGAAFQKTKFDISAGITGIATTGNYVGLPDYTGATEPARFTTDNSISTPLYLYANYKPAEWMSVGLAFNTPYGSSVKWNDDWAGAHLIQDISLAAYNLQPTVSFRIAKHLTVGAGLMLAWGEFDLSKSLLPVGAATNTMLDGMLAAIAPQYAGVFAGAGDRAIASMRLEGSAKMAAGVNLGIMWDPHEQWTLGFSYRSKIMMKADSGDASLKLIDNAQIAQLVQMMLPKIGLDPTVLDAAKIRIELPLPATLTWGVSFRPQPRWEFALDAEYTLWSAYQNLRVDLLLPDGSAKLLSDSQKNYSNTIAVRFGGQYHAAKWLTARMGIYADESPVSSDYLNPETPSMTKLAFTAGVTLRPARFMAVDLAYGYVNSADPERTGSTVFENPITKQTESFAGNYKATAHTFSIGARFNF